MQSSSKCCGPPSPEVCDNIDNDCDGTVDGFATTCGIGSCAAVGTCTDGSDSCVPGAPSAEVCDGVDNDCDESIDEGGDALCSDGNTCNGVETCRSFSGCQPGTPLNCADGNSCTADSCDRATGCVYTPIAGCNPADGCGDGTREGFGDLATYPSVAACAGPWSARIDGPSAAALCSAGWHVCSPAASTADRQILGAITYGEAVGIPGCFAFNAAHDNGTCVPCTDDGTADDMGAVGANCTRGYYNPTWTSCLGTGRIDADCCEAYATNHACRQNDTNPHTGVVCCKT